MRIGISLTSSWGGTAPSAAAAAMIERTAAAYEAGLDSLSVGDHHGQATNYVQNTPILGRLLAEWPDRRVGALFLLPLWNPVLVAEQVATLAALTDAPFIVQTGIGSGEAQFGAMGASQNTRGVVTDESIRLIQELLTGELSASDRLNVAPTRLGMVPSNDIEWWIGGHSGAAIRRTAEYGNVWYAGPVLADDDATRIAAAYRTQCEARGKVPRMTARRDVLVLDDGERAHQLVDDAVARGYRGMSREQLLVGDVDDAVADAQRLAALGFEALIMRCVSDDQNVALETIKVMGEANRRLAAVLP